MIRRPPIDTRTATLFPDTTLCRSGRLRAPRHRRRLVRRQAHGEAGAADAPALIVAVVGADAAAVGIDDLLRDAEAESGMGAELLARRTFGVEALEHRLQFALRNAGPLVGDGDHDVASLALRCKADGAAGRREGDRKSTRL